MEKIYDVIIIGGGISGSFIASELTQKGLSCLMLEAGKFFSSSTFPKRELDGNSQLYWGGGIELNQSASLALLRPKAVGGGSIVNQALLDRFDDLAWSDWKSTSEVSFFDKEQMAIYYDQAEKKMAIQEIDQKYRNKNAEVFFDGFKNNGYQLAPLRRAQKNCDYENGNDCV